VRRRALLLPTMYLRHAGLAHSPTFSYLYSLQGRRLIIFELISKKELEIFAESEKFKKDIIG